MKEACDNIFSKIRIGAIPISARHAGFAGRANQDGGMAEGEWANLDRALGTEGIFYLNRL
jgi:hypothetical protein